MKFIKNYKDIIINCDAIQKIIVSKYLLKSRDNEEIWFVRACYTDGSSYDNLHNDLPNEEVACLLRDAIVDRILSSKTDGTMIDVNEIYSHITSN